MTAISITLDVDWAPDFMIDRVAELLVAARVPATWYVTHASPAIDRLRRHPDLFELGIHPNFLPGSSHGATAEAVLDHCMNLVPDATTMRTHALVQSSPLLATVLAHTPIIGDASLLLLGLRHLEPVEFMSGGKVLVRVPFFWEDDDEMEYAAPSWEIGLRLDAPGLRVFDFHPLHVYLNSASPAAYRRLKGLGPINALTAEMVKPVIQTGAGAGTFFEALLAAASGRSDVLRVDQIVDRYRHARGLGAPAAARGAGGGAV